MITQKWFTSRPAVEEYWHPLIYWGSARSHTGVLRLESLISQTVRRLVEQNDGEES